jgi:hypothetical protein
VLSLKKSQEIRGNTNKNEKLKVFGQDIGFGTLRRISLLI